MESNINLSDLSKFINMASCFENNLNDTANFELYVETMPANRCYLIAAGLEQIVDYILNFKFEEQEIEYLKEKKIFKKISKEFFDYLKNFKFSGDIWAMPEGSVFFQNEPVIRITAPLIEAQLIGTYVMSMFEFQSKIATKSTLFTYAAKGSKVIDSSEACYPFGSIYASRAAFIGGCTGTTNINSGKKFGIPVYGTMSESWVLGFENEDQAFQNFIKIFPESSIIFLSTYDSVKAVRKVEKLDSVAKGVRIDEGDYYYLSVRAREILDNVGLQDVIVIAGGDINEVKIKRLVNQNAPIDLFIAGRELVTSADSPYINLSYRIVEVEKAGNILPKGLCTEDEVVCPYKKQVWRFIDDKNRLIKDIIADDKENYSPEAFPLLAQVVDKGVQTLQNQPLGKIKKFCLNNLLYLNKHTFGADCTVKGKVEISENLKSKV